MPPPAAEPPAAPKRRGRPPRSNKTAEEAVPAPTPEPPQPAKAPSPPAEPARPEPPAEPVRMTQLDVAKRDNVWIFRRASSWNTTDIMQWIIQMIGHVFRTKLAGLGFQPILLLDAASVHTAQSVIRTARLQHVFLAPIPPACTAFVQPLDVYTFARYKRFLEDQFREHRMVRTGPVSVHEWFKLLFRACDWLRSEPWHVAFSLSGLPNLGLDLHRDLAKLFPGGRVTFCQRSPRGPRAIARLTSAPQHVAHFLPARKESLHSLGFGGAALRRPFQAS